MSDTTGPGNSSSTRDDAHPGELARHGAVRALLIVAGSIALALGIVGIFLPILPTTPFLLLAAACYARGSRRFYDWLLGNRWFGSYIRNYREGRGVPLRAKAVSIALLWTTILISAYFFVPWLLVRVILLVVAALVTIHIILIKTLK